LVIRRARIALPGIRVFCADTKIAMKPTLPNTAFFGLFIELFYELVSNMRDSCICGPPDKIVAIESVAYILELILYIDRTADKFFRASRRATG